MAGAAAVAAAAAVASALSGIIGGNKAKHAAEDAAREESRLEGLVTKEKLRQLGKEEVALKGATIAAAAGSGVKVDKGSPLEVMTEQSNEFFFEKQIVEKVGASKAALALQQGRAIGQQAQYSGYSQGFAGLSNMLSIIAANRAPATPPATTPPGTS